MNKKILICGGTGCLSSKSKDIKENLEKELKERNINDVEVVLTGCFGFCEKGPIVKVVPANNFYIEVKPEDAKKIVEIDIIGDKKVERILYKDPVSQEAILDYKKMNFYQKQERRVLKNCGVIDPENIDDFLRNDGYKAAEKAISEMTKEFVIKNIIDSGLRGRGGGGFPTGIKWDIASKNHAEQKYIVCNADEGDPGAFMDRSILEGDPHSVIEGMMIAGYAIGATKGLVYIRAEYPLAISRLDKAIVSARKRGYLGKNLFGTDFEFDIEIKFGAGAFVCGEETALIHSMEGKRGEPTSKPPYPAEKGFWDMPTVVNNVETLVNVPRIILNGVEWFREVGTEKSPGTKVFALSGKINNVGLVEVPMGISLREIIFEIGEGIKGGKKFKAVQTGGPSGGCLNEEDLDTPIDFDSLASKGAIMGSGGMVVMDEDDCMVSVAKFFLEFTLDESCGKCTPCRIGNTRLYEILDRITKGKGKLEDLALLKELSECIKATSLCGLGQTSANPVLSTLNKFYNEYIDHVVEKRCTAKACQKLITYVITDACRGCTACTRVCAVKAIEGNIKEKHFIDPEKCVRCGACISACRFGAIIKL
ncbi:MULTISPECIES: NADH-quinone oxidoreductase subunit NuoF [Fusobacterium]|jgi:NADP-reducing hydrogenase subunit HndC|uniref:4Fe-4S dicluster domain-containing protein n=1 Tax=Fusobacterium mortiferum ATCC 9817 TaxID=469616 RepID=A0ABM6TVF3_FUSMR|nr:MULTISPECIES: NADH-quinone oxidoreductase subunit NuoF [Fusobacterium]AVQ18210.1 4Fe-4S dicluster domain-containing protein [Fusobacterium mortiferum ATCC 9817]EEO34440.1 protein HymB [Fusobacterium mortiferum ATCC 9817]MCI6381624.1 NADH-quinone oxidoreductase subunit NuoF [Fusobacterium mortiferum]MCI7665587.1 NADH-quinone oxidoreductase subunit NuoF [Fusobacterium mortiferum]MDY5980606.1 NADH-quinone oxidoreductase subunit NuoF [Fusobacterium mortiferum]